MNTVIPFYGLYLRLLQLFIKVDRNPGILYLDLRIIYQHLNMYKDP